MKAIVLCLAPSGLSASAQELQFTNIAFSFVTFTELGLPLDKSYQWRAVEIKDDGTIVSRINGAELNVAVEDLKQAAESGDVVAQVQFAACLYDGRHGVATNHIDAYKWAMVAPINGQRNAEYLVREMELFLAPEEMADGKAAAKSFLGMKAPRRKA